MCMLAVLMHSQQAADLFLFGRFMRPAWGRRRLSPGGDVRNWRWWFPCGCTHSARRGGGLQVHPVGRIHVAACADACYLSGQAKAARSRALGMREVRKFG